MEAGILQAVGACWYKTAGFGRRGNCAGTQLAVGHGLFHQLLEQKHFGTVDDGVDAVLEGFHRG